MSIYKYLFKSYVLNSTDLLKYQKGWGGGLRHGETAVITKTCTLSNVQFVKITFVSILCFHLGKDLQRNSREMLLSFPNEIVIVIIITLSNKQHYLTWKIITRILCLIPIKVIMSKSYHSSNIIKHLNEQ